MNITINLDSFLYTPISFLKFLSTKNRELYIHNMFKERNSISFFEKIGISKEFLWSDSIEGELYWKNLHLKHMKNEKKKDVQIQNFRFS